MDFKALSNYAISIHMDARPQSKKVPLVFPAWLVFDQATEDSICFRECQLLLDRHGAVASKYKYSVLMIHSFTTSNIASHKVLIHSTRLS